MRWYLRADVQARQPMDPSLGLSEMLTLPALYYPGSGTDVGPFNVFTRHGTVSTVVYCDGGVTEHDARTIVDKLDGWTLVRRQQFTPRDLGQHNWADFWPKGLMARHYGDPDHGYGLLTILARTESKQRVCLINLGTEALQTFRILADRGFRPESSCCRTMARGATGTALAGDDRDFTRRPAIIFRRSPTLATTPTSGLCTIGSRNAARKRGHRVAHPRHLAAQLDGARRRRDATDLKWRRLVAPRERAAPRS